MVKYTFSKHVKFRKEKQHIAICDCKMLRDFKVGLGAQDITYSWQK